jgi:hypothetical protein
MVFKIGEKVIGRTFDAEPVCCGVCQRQAVGLGWAPKQGKPVLWLCSDANCHSLGEIVFKMPKDKLTAFETWALHDAGELAGAYLESVGKFDLSELSEAEWFTFLKTIMQGYGDKMRDRLLNHKAPF